MADGHILSAPHLEGSLIFANTFGILTSIKDMPFARNTLAPVQ